MVGSVDAGICLDSWVPSGLAYWRLSAPTSTEMSIWSLVSDPCRSPFIGSFVNYFYSCWRGCGRETFQMLPYALCHSGDPRNLLGTILAETRHVAISSQWLLHCPGSVEFFCRQTWKLRHGCPLLFDPPFCPEVHLFIPQI